MLGHLYIVVVQFFLTGGGKTGGNDGQHVSAHFLGPLAHVDGVPGGDAASSGIDWDPAFNLVDGGLQHFLLLLHTQDIALTIGAEGKDTVNTAVNLALNLVAQFRDIHILGFGVHGSNNGYDDAFQFHILHDSSSFPENSSCTRVTEFPDTGPGRPRE